MGTPTRLYLLFVQREKKFGLRSRLGHFANVGPLNPISSFVRHYLKPKKVRDPNCLNLVIKIISEVFICLPQKQLKSCWDTSCPDWPW